MPQAFGINAAKALDTSVPPASRQPIAGGGYGGHLTVIHDEFVIPAAGAGSAQNDTVVLGEIAKGTMVVDVLLSFEAMGTGVTLSLGTDDSAARFVSAAAAAAIGTARIAQSGHGYTADAKRQIIATIGGGAPTAAKRFKATTIVMHL